MRESCAAAGGSSVVEERVGTTRCQCAADRFVGYGEGAGYLDVGEGSVGGPHMIADVEVAEGEPDTAVAGVLVEVLVEVRSVGGRLAPNQVEGNHK